MVFVSRFLAHANSAKPKEPDCSSSEGMTQREVAVRILLDRSLVLSDRTVNQVISKMPFRTLPFPPAIGFLGDEGAERHGGSPIAQEYDIRIRNFSSVGQPPSAVRAEDSRGCYAL